MPVTDDHVALVRAYLAGDDDGYANRQSQIQDQDVLPIYTLASAAFTKAMKETFAENRDDLRGAIIRFVGATRARSTRAVRIDPLVAERLIGFALGLTSDEPEADAHRTRLRVLWAVVIDRPIDAAGLDDLLERARHLAELRLSVPQGIQPRSRGQEAFLADLRCDEETFQERVGQGEPSGVLEYARLAAAALRVLLEAHGKRSNVIELVGDVRARSKWWANHVDTLAAEQAVRRLVSEGTLDAQDPSHRQTARLLLRALADEQWLEDAERYELLIKAWETVR